MDSALVRSLVFFVGFVASSAAFAASSGDEACRSGVASRGYPASIAYSDFAFIAPINSYPGSQAVHCYVTENGTGHYNVFDDSYEIPPPPPPHCASPQNLGPRSIPVGFATGSSSNSPIVGKLSNPYVGSYCEGSCEVVAPLNNADGSANGGLHDSVNPGPNGYYAVNWNGNVSSTGNACSESAATPAPSGTLPEPTPASVGKDKCPPGTVSGGIDSAGTPICIGSGSAPSTSTTTKTAPVVLSNADGSSTSTTTEKTTNADGSTTTTTTSSSSGGTNADGSAKAPSTTKSTNTTPATNGTPGKADAPESDLCKLHPELNICKNSSVSGSCESVACDGDAIQCAQLRTQQKALCEQEKETELGKAAAALSGDSMNGLPTAKNAAVTDIGQAGSSLDSSGFAGSGACFADKTVSIMGKSVTMSFSVVCSYLGYLKYVVLLIAMLGAYKIIGGALLRET